jgi:catechol 2,3-dioxygenase-like lactoylglutathione lyase family enzyme
MITGIHHFGLTVRDVDASAAWYEEVLGFRRAGEFKAPDGTRRKAMFTEPFREAQPIASAGR